MIDPRIKILETTVDMLLDVNGHLRDYISVLHLMNEKLVRGEEE